MSGSVIPQLDVSTFPSQLFWLGVSFSVLYAACSRWILPRVEGALDGRQRRLDALLSQASRLHQEATDLSHKTQKILNKSREQSHLALSKALATLRDDYAHQQAALRQDFTNRAADASRALDEATEEIRQELLKSLELLVRSAETKLQTQNPSDWDNMRRLSS